MEQAAAVFAKMCRDDVAAVCLARVRSEGSAQDVEVVCRYQQIVSKAVSGQTSLVDAVAPELEELICF